MVHYKNAASAARFGHIIYMQDAKEITTASLLAMNVQIRKEVSLERGQMDFVLTGISYLGEMTEQAFNTTPDWESPCSIKVRW